MFERAVKTAGEGAAFEYILGRDGESYALGQTLKLSAGRLTACTGTDKPTFICEGAQPAEQRAVTPIAVSRVIPGQRYRAPLSLTLLETYVGDRVTIADDGLRVGTISASGAFTLTRMDDVNQGSFVEGCFA